MPFPLVAPEFGGLMGQRAGTGKGGPRLYGFPTKEGGDACASELCRPPFHTRREGGFSPLTIHF